MREALDRLRAAEGSELGVSDWVPVSQAMLDAHAATTGDRDWIHNDPDRARRDGPFGTTIAQGSLLLSHLVRFQEQVLPTLDNPALAYALNYGFDRVRFVRPVPVDVRIRGRLALREVRDRPDGALVVFDVRVEVDDEDDAPAVVAQWLGLVRFA
jgi:acyl dehydratase